MKKHSLYAWTTLFLLLLGPGLSASEIRGVIVKADEKAKEITVEVRGRGPRGAVITFATKADTHVRIGKQEAGFADLAPGKRVRVFFEDRDGRPLALSIQIIGLPVLAPPPDGTPAIFPGPGDPRRGSTPPLVRDPNAIAGNLRRISVTEGEIVLVSPGPGGQAEQETPLVVADHVRILRDGKPIRLEDLKENEPVVIHTSKREDKLLATEIEAGTASKTAPTGTPRENRIEKVRRILQTIDGFLQMVQEGRPPG